MDRTKRGLGRRQAAGEEVDTSDTDRFDADTAAVAEQRTRALIKPIRKRLDGHDAAISGLRVDLEHVSHAVRAVEHQIEALAAANEPAVIGSTDEIAAARNVLEQVRREHERIRVRLEMIGAFEERFRRMEEAVVTMYGGDLRGPGAGSSP